MSILFSGGMFGTESQEAKGLGAMLHDCRQSEASVSTLCCVKIKTIPALCILRQESKYLLHQSISGLSRGCNQKRGGTRCSCMLRTSSILGFHSSLFHIYLNIKILTEHRYFNAWAILRIGNYGIEVVCFAIKS